jgi:hypothetical protein
VRNSITGGVIGIMVGSENVPGTPDSITIGGSTPERNTITGQIPSSEGGYAISLSFRCNDPSYGDERAYQGCAPIVATHNDFGVYTAAEVRNRIWERGDTTDGVFIPPVDTVYTDPFYSPKIAVNVKVFLQGPYNTGTNQMTNGLRTGGYLDTKFGSGEAPALAVDSINLELRNARTGAGSSTRKYAPAWLLTDGTILDFNDTTKSYVQFDTTDGFYYIVVWHRNHLAIMTLDSLPLSATSTLYDFSTAQGQAYGLNPMIQRGTRFCMVSGDANANGLINALDRGQAWNERTRTGYQTSDVDLNGVCNASDRGTVWNNRTRAAQVP